MKTPKVKGYATLFEFRHFFLLLLFIFHLQRYLRSSFLPRSFVFGIRVGDAHVPDEDNCQLGNPRLLVIDLHHLEQHI